MIHQLCRVSSMLVCLATGRVCLGVFVLLQPDWAKISHAIPRPSVPRLAGG